MASFGLFTQVELLNNTKKPTPQSYIWKDKNPRPLAFRRLLNHCAQVTFMDIKYKSKSYKKRFDHFLMKGPESIEALEAKIAG